MLLLSKIFTFSQFFFKFFNFFNNFQKLLIFFFFKNFKNTLNYTSCLNTKFHGHIHFIRNTNYMKIVLITSSADHGQSPYVKMGLRWLRRDFSIQGVEILWFVRFADFILIDGYPMMTHLTNTGNLIKIVDLFVYFKIMIFNQQFNTMDYSWKSRVSTLNVKNL